MDREGGGGLVRGHLLSAHLEEAWSTEDSVVWLHPEPEEP